MFNVCGAVASGIPSACATVTGIGKAGALQIDARVLSDPSDDYCFLAGVYGDSSTKVSLLDQEDPSKGISVTYYGSYCHTPMVQRKFRIELECADKLSPIPTSALEFDHCSYTVTMPSVYGCPLECPIANRALCGGNGHCSYDVDKGAARCFCNHGASPSTSSAPHPFLSLPPSVPLLWRLPRLLVHREGRGRGGAQLLPGALRSHHHALRHHRSPRRGDILHDPTDVSL
jgi:hypothetical protein